MSSKNFGALGLIIIVAVLCLLWNNQELSCQENKESPQINQRLQEAIDYVRTISSQGVFDEDKYLTECEYLVDHQDELPYRIFIVLPGVVNKDNESQREKIKQGSEERCGCGNERTIFPGNPRTDFMASLSGEIVISPDNEVYLKPIRGDKVSAYIKLWIEDEDMRFIDEPFAPYVFDINDLFSSNGFNLKEFSVVLPKEPKPPLMVSLQGEYQIPLFVITTVDPVAKTVTIILDKAVEVFNPDDYDDSHDCSK